MGEGIGGGDLTDPAVFQGPPRVPPHSTPATSRDKASSTEATEHLRRARPPSSSGLMATSRQAFCPFPDPRPALCITCDKSFPCGHEE